MSRSDVQNKDPRNVTLIEAVRCCTELWNLNTDKYTHGANNVEKWKMVADVVNRAHPEYPPMTDANVKKRWNTLRDSYRRAYKTYQYKKIKVEHDALRHGGDVKNNNSIMPLPPTWPYYTYMSFLDTVLSTNVNNNNNANGGRHKGGDGSDGGGGNNVSSASNNNDNNDVVNQLFIGGYSMNTHHTYSLTSNNQQQQVTSHKRKSPQSTNSLITSNGLANAGPKPDDMELFLESLGSDAKRVRVDLRVELKIKLLEVVQDFLHRSEQQQPSSPPPPPQQQQNTLAMSQSIQQLTHVQQAQLQHQHAQQLQQQHQHTQL